MLRTGSVLLGIALLASAVSAAQPGPTPMVALETGGVRRGAGSAAFSDAGRMSLYVGADCLIQNAAIGCGLNGFTNSDHFQKSRVVREAGRFHYEGKLPGHDVRFTLDAVPQGDALQVTIQRDGEWPAAAGWCSFQMLLPISQYGGTTVLADDRSVTLPRDRAASTIVGGAKRLVFAEGDPTVRLELQGENLAINDARQWNSPMYQVSVPISTQPGKPSAQTSFVLRFPEGSPDQLKPRLCVSAMGYSAAGLKELTMEWPKGMPRPADDIRIEDAAGEIVAQGNFSPTLALKHMQNDFASFEFPAASAPGTYRAIWSAGEPVQFQVKPTLFDEAAWTATLDTFIPWQMCHADITFADGSLPHLPACHMDDGQRVPANFPGIDGFRSYEADRTPYREGEMIPSGIGGWHDAGDYDINVHATGHTLWKLALAFEEFHIQHDRTAIDVAAQRVIVGRPDGTPDILQQIEWGARWMLKMQQSDGLVYVGICCRPGGQYTAAVLPEKLSDGKPGTGDERYVYVDYQPATQLAQVISLAAVSRALRDSNPELSRQCIDAAEAALAYFKQAPDHDRPNAYFSKKSADGRLAAMCAALAELHLSTGKAQYLNELTQLAPGLEQAKVGWPADYATGTGGWWYAPSVLARLGLRLEDGELKSAITDFCRRAVAEQASQSSPRPWPFQWWHVLDWGAAGHALNRVFDAYYLEKLIPGQFTLENTQREMLWVYGYHPLSDTVFVDLKGLDGPKFVYNGRLHGRYGDAPASVPGAVVPGMGGVQGAGMVTYSDRHGNYYHNEACIYTAADYLFAVHALKSAGY